MIAGKACPVQAADIWSIGVILFALLDGYLLFEHANTNLLCKESPSWMSGAAKSLLHKMLNTDPAQRYAIAHIRKHPWYRQVGPQRPAAQGAAQHEQRSKRRTTRSTATS